MADNLELLEVLAFAVGDTGGYRGRAALHAGRVVLAQDLFDSRAKCDAGLVAATYRAGILFQNDHIAAVPLEAEAVEQAREGAPNLDSSQYRGPSDLRYALPLTITAVLGGAITSHNS